jgi:hypothetical protein
MREKPEKDFRNKGGENKGEETQQTRALAEEK